jgi:hypothetical protein
MNILQAQQRLRQVMATAGLFPEQKVHATKHAIMGMLLLLPQHAA